MAYRYVPPHEELHRLLDEIADMIPRVQAMLSPDMLENDTDRDLLRWAIAPARALRSALLDVQQTHMHSANHRYGAAMLAHEAPL